MKKKLIITSLFIFSLVILQPNTAEANYKHSIQIGGDGNKETIEYYNDENEEKNKRNNTTTINYNYITPVDYPSSYYDSSYYYPYARSSRYRVLTTYPYMGAMYMPPPPRPYLHYGHRPPPPRHHLHHGHRHPHPIHRPPHRHHVHNRVHIGLPGVHVSF